MSTIQPFIKCLNSSSSSSSSEKKCQQRKQYILQSCQWVCLKGTHAGLPVYHARKKLYLKFNGEHENTLITYDS